MIREHHNLSSTKLIVRHVCTSNLHVKKLTGKCHSVEHAFNEQKKSALNLVKSIRILMVYVCMYVCMCVCIYVCVCMYVCVYVCMCVCMYVCV